MIEDPFTTKFKSANRSWKKSIRETVIPFLPPPLTRAIHKFDLAFEVHVGSEASVTIGTTLIVAWILWILILIKGRQVLFGRGRAIIDDEDQQGFVNSRDGERCKATVVFCGPISSGKTRMFYELCYGQDYDSVPTLMSLTVNVAIGTDRYLQTDKSKVVVDYFTNLIRYVDWPGRASLEDPSFVGLMSSLTSKALRFILVVDSTQPVGPAAEVLYQLLVLAHDKRDKDPVNIFIACHKNDLAKSKNHKRIKIQLRTELEKLLAIKDKATKAQRLETTTATKGETMDNSPCDPPADFLGVWPIGKPLDFDELTFCRLYFASTNCSERGLTEIIEYCSTGSFPESSNLAKR